MSINYTNSSPNIKENEYYIHKKTAVIAVIRTILHRLRIKKKTYYVDLDQGAG